MLSKKVGLSADYTIADVLEKKAKTRSFLPLLFLVFDFCHIYVDFQTFNGVCAVVGSLVVVGVVAMVVCCLVCVCL